jgi:hypothetical protein
MGEPAKIDDLLNRYRGLEGLGVQLGQHDVFARPGESIPNKSEPGRRAIRSTIGRPMISPSFTITAPRKAQPNLP